MLNVIYENGDVAVLNKPAGVAVHPSAHNPEGKTLVSEILARWPEIKNVGEDPMRPGIVHRLDKETSGVMVIAKNQGMFFWLKKQFQERKIEKRYTALVFGRMPVREGKIDLPLARSRKLGKFTTSRGGKKATSPIKGKLREAATSWRVLKEYKDREGNVLSLLELKPETGRTHQIRVHLAAIGRPIIADPLYGGKKIRSFRESLGRIFLHARSLRISLPSAKGLLVEADLAEDLTGFLKSLRPLEEEDSS